MTRNATFPTGDVVALPDDTIALPIFTPAGRWGVAPWSLQGIGGGLALVPYMRGWVWPLLGREQHLAAVEAMNELAAIAQTGPLLGSRWYLDGGSGVRAGEVSELPPRTVALVWHGGPNVATGGRTWEDPSYALDLGDQHRAWRWCVIDATADDRLSAGDVGAGISSQRVTPAPGRVVLYGGLEMYPVNVTMGVARSPMLARRIAGRLVWRHHAFGTIPAGTILAAPFDPDAPAHAGLPGGDPPLTA